MDRSTGKPVEDKNCHFFPFLQAFIKRNVPILIILIGFQYIIGYLLESCVVELWHGFTNPEADDAGVPALAYNEAADRRSWKAMLGLFEEVF